MSHQAYASNTAYSQGLPTSIVPPISKPRIGQGRAAVRRKPKVAPPTPKPTQTPAPPIPIPPQEQCNPLHEPVIQSQERTLPQHHILAAPQPFFTWPPKNIT